MNKVFWKRIFEGFKTLCIIGIAFLLIGIAFGTAITIGVMLGLCIIKYVPAWITITLGWIFILLCLSYKLGERE